MKTAARLSIWIVCGLPGSAWSGPLLAEQALARLAAGEDAAGVALASGCADVGALEAWLFGGREDFARIEAGAGAADAQAANLDTPLRAEARGLRPQALYWSQFTSPTLLGLGFGGGHGFADPGWGYDDRDRWGRDPWDSWSLRPSYRVYERSRRSDPGGQPRTRIQEPRRDAPEPRGPSSSPRESSGRAARDRAEPIRQR